MPKGPAAGYVYGLISPDDPTQTQIIFVGNSRKPWESIAWHLYDSINPAVREWAQKFRADHPGGIQILGENVVRRWLGEEVPEDPDPMPGVVRLNWVVLGQESEEASPGPSGSPDPSGAKIYGTTRKLALIRQLLREGHPLLNGLPGRPRKSKLSE